MTTVLVVPALDAIDTREAFETVSEAVPAHIDFITPRPDRISARAQDRPGLTPADSRKVSEKARRPPGEKAMMRPSARCAHVRSITKSRSRAPRAPPRWLRRSLQSRQRRHIGRRPCARTSRSRPRPCEKTPPRVGQLGIVVVGEDASTPSARPSRPRRIRRRDGRSRRGRFASLRSRGPVRTRTAPVRSARFIRPFQHRRDVGTGQAEVAMPALPRPDDEPGLGELGEMAARRLKRHARRLRQFVHRQGPAVHEGSQNVGSRGIADQGRDRGRWMVPSFIS